MPSEQKTHGVKKALQPFILGAVGGALVFQHNQHVALVGVDNDWIGATDTGD